MDSNSHFIQTNIQFSHFFTAVIGLVGRHGRHAGRKSCCVLFFKLNFAWTWRRFFVLETFMISNQLHATTLIIVNCHFSFPIPHVICSIVAVCPNRNIRKGNTTRCSTIRSRLVRTSNATGYIPKSNSYSRMVTIYICPKHNVTKKLGRVNVFSWLRACNKSDKKDWKS